VFDRCRIHSLDRGSADNNGYVTAGSHQLANPYGFLFYRCRLTSDAADRTVYLGRPWHAGGDPLAVAQVLVRQSWLGPHIKDAPWTDMSGWSWRDARFSEYRTYGPGARANPDRPRLPAESADDYQTSDYLNGWNPR
jgi:pectinesterase